MATDTLILEPPVAKKEERLITLEAFLERYPNLDTPFKYEWNNGVVEKTEQKMNRNQLPIVEKLQDLFYLVSKRRHGGLLTAEVDVYLPTINRTRRADLAYLSPELLEKAKDNFPTVCPFLIEIVSKNDQINENDDKLLEYFANGVEVVWFIKPHSKMVEVHTSPRDVKKCFEDDICSAAPVLPDFNISVNDLFH
jgi:Uma2 family endonuclease